MRLISFVFFLTIYSFSFSQHEKELGVIEKVTNFFEFELHNKSRDSSDYVTKLVLAPIIAFEPSTSLQFGIGSKLLFKFKNSTPETRTSNLPVSVKYTLRKQFIISTEYTFFTNEEKFLIKGGGKFLKFPFSYFGVGNTTSEADIIEVDISNFLFEPLVLKRIYKGLFIGGGVRLNNVWGAKLTHHEHLSRANERLAESINTFSTGLEFASTLDSRDNVLNAYNGVFVELTQGFYSKRFGGTNDFAITKLDARKYYQRKRRRDDVLAFQFFSRFTSGDTPLIELSSLGGRDLLRGYQESRFNAKHAVFLQSEYRWQALSRLGFVFYGGMGDVFSKVTDDLSFNKLKYSLGTGLRIKIVKSENLNIRLDYGIGLGPTNDHNIYLGLAEAF